MRSVYFRAAGWIAEASINAGTATGARPFGATLVCREYSVLSERAPALLPSGLVLDLVGQRGSHMTLLTDQQYFKGEINRWMLYHQAHELCVGLCGQYGSSPCIVFTAKRLVAGCKFLVLCCRRYDRRYHKIYSYWNTGKKTGATGLVTLRTQASRKVFLILVVSSASCDSSGCSGQLVMKQTWLSR